MTEHSLWRLSRAIQSALTMREFTDLDLAIDDDIDWAIYGPIDMFPFLGARQGRSEVMSVCREIGAHFSLHRFERESVMVDKDRASSLIRCSLTSRKTRKPISVRLAHFAQFRDGRLSSLRAIIDSFDLVEQTLGRPIDLPALHA